MSYKNSLNLPKTDFPMRANLPVREPRILEFWQKINLYQHILDMNSECEKYVLHDGPPYANGDIHIGHALNKSLKDIIVKFMTMKGRKVVFLPGWDCHGLPVEYSLFKKLDKTKHEVDILEFRKKAYDYATKYVEIQKREFKRLGVFGLWDESYLTLDFKYESVMLRALSKLVEKGFIYRGLKPVNWCSKCETALAEAEVEYEIKKSASIYIKFPLLNQDNGYSSSLLVWTTTPWTLVGNVACAINPDLEYVKFLSSKDNDKNSECYIVAKSLLSDIVDKTDIKNYKLLEEFKGKDLKIKEVKHPFLEKNSQIIFSNFVSGEEGTGCVHIAPGHGEEDYEVGKIYQLPMYMPVDDKGRFVPKYKNLNKNVKDNKVYKTPGYIAGENVFKANNLIISKLKDSNKLLHQEDIEHSYPTCWRCKTPIIFRATKQWFMSVDHNKLRNKILEFSKNIKWIPHKGERRFIDMIENRPDWCLSRQRLWGVPIPALTCLDCKEDMILPDIINKVAKIVEVEGSDVWFKNKLGEIFSNSEIFSCPFCGSKNIDKLDDITDVWFESGVSHLAVLTENPDLSHPANLYLEGSDQHRGWFQTSMLTSMAILDNAPFKAVLTHGFVVDAEGKKMSKSRGNVVSPLDIFKQYGADVLRLWVISCDYTSDVKISKQILSGVAEAYRKIRNTIKFLLGNLYDFSSNDAIKYNSLLEIDKWMLVRTMNLLKYTEGKYQKFDFYKIYRKIYDFCILDLSSFYLDVLKDRLYIFKKDSLERRSAQTAIYHVLVTLVKIITPVVPFTGEEVWQHLPETLKENHKESVHLEKFPELNKIWLDEELEKKWQKLLDIRNEVLKALEIRREEGKIGSPLEAKVVLYTDKEKIFKFLDTFSYELKYIFIISEFEFVKVDSLSEVENFTIESDSMKLEVKKAEGKKCERCWNYSKFVGESEEYPDLCQRCISQMTDIRG